MLVAEVLRKSRKRLLEIDHTALKKHPDACRAAGDHNTMRLIFKIRKKQNTGLCKPNEHEVCRLLKLQRFSFSTSLNLPADLRGKKSAPSARWSQL